MAHSSTPRCAHDRRKFLLFSRRVCDRGSIRNDNILFHGDTMTALQEEYIITEFQLKQLQGYVDLDFVCQAIRSRPLIRTPTLPDEVCRICEDCRVKHDTAIAAQAREKVLCELLAFIHPDSRAGCVIKEYLESLRRKP